MSENRDTDPAYRAKGITSRSSLARGKRTSLCAGAVIGKYVAWKPADVVSRPRTPARTASARRLTLPPAHPQRRLISNPKPVPASALQPPPVDSPSGSRPASYRRARHETGAVTSPSHTKRQCPNIPPYQCRTAHGKLQRTRSLAQVRSTP